MPMAPNPSSRPHCSISRARRAKWSCDDAEENMTRIDETHYRRGVNKIIEERTLFLADDAATLQLGAQIARGIDSIRVITLCGELGAGKTTLVRGMLRALGWAGAVKSPS